MHNLPQRVTPLIDRDEELAYVVAKLAEPDCRLLALIGSGGVGKTRLAVEAAAACAPAFADGVTFVDLQPVKVDFLATAIVDALPLFFSGQDAHQTQLLNFLRTKKMLLVLDNFEHLLSQTTFLSELLRETPAIKLLVTSREALHLQNGWLYPLSGLSVPPESANPETLEDYGAVQLFLERVRRLQPDFSLEDEQDGVLRICRLVGGMPLALELAASWIRVLPCTEIAAEVQRNLDFLTTTMCDVPERHRSMQAVFDQSWRLLSEEERNVFKRLSVFRGGFRREAAEQIAGATLYTLSALVDKCLLWRDTNSRYHIHQLLDQYVAEQLETIPDDVQNTYNAHCRYYADFLLQRRMDIDGGRQREVALEIAEELENVRGMWQWAQEHTLVAEIQASIQTFTVFAHIQSRFLEAANILEQAKRSLEFQEPAGRTGLTLAELLVALGSFYIRLGRFAEARTVLTEGRDLYERLGAAPAPGMATDPLPKLAILANIQGNHRQAIQLAQEALKECEARADEKNRIFACYILTSALQAQGNYSEARYYAQQACDMAEALNDRWFVAYCRNEWGNVARALGDYAEARQHFRLSYAIRQEFNDPEGMAIALRHLGEIAILQEDFEEAGQLYRQSLAIYQELNDHGGLAAAYSGLGQASFAAKRYQEARQHLRQALDIAADIQFVSLLLSILSHIGELFLHTGAQERGVALLGLVRRHPASDQETQDRAQFVLKRREADFAPERFMAAFHQLQTSELDATIDILQSELAVTPESSHLDTKTSDAHDDGFVPTHALIEPLTERELDVLRHIAAGLSNFEIADEMMLALGTIKWYASRIYRKLHANSRTEAVARARELSLLS